jgi:UDP-N-acetylglucosamine diphosphorylase/glucosamine-1-phosphate N-acetyltransferase
VTGPALVLFDDRVARDWRPFTLTRPAGELLFGTATLRARAEHALGATCVGHVSGAHLRDYDEPWAPAVVDPGTLDASTGCVYLLSRCVPEPAELPEAPALLTMDGRVVGCRLEPGAPPPDVGFFLDPDARAPELPRHALPGTVLERVWELVTGNADRLARDLEGADHAALARDVHHLGPGPVSVGEDVEIAPGVVLDTRHGPIRLDDGVRVEPYTRLVGPAYVGPGTTLLGGPFDAVSIGPVCKVHGEVEESVILGYTNKAHDGFLGHAYLGMWVNLGALTTNSDLKNNYGTVRVWTPGGETDTGSRKIGCLLGDHVKTAIGTLLNTGTVVEAGSNIFGGMPPKYVPPFSWGGPGTDYDIDRFLATAETVLGRRDVALTDAQRSLLRAARETGRPDPGDG